MNGNSCLSAKTGCAHFYFYRMQRPNIEWTDDKDEPEAVPKPAVEGNQATKFGISSPAGSGRAVVIGRMPRANQSVPSMTTADTTPTKG